MGDLELTVRRNREIADPGLPCREENLRFGEMQWRVPVDQSALVLVDCWSEHPLQSHLERGGGIARDRILPALRACRAAGMAVVHAPAPQIASKYPQWLFATDDTRAADQPAAVSDWPPAEFKQRTGRWSAYARPREPVLDEWVRTRDPLRGIMELLGPEGDDVVVATGGELHEFCRQREILHLFYAGFAANICVQFRDYGVRAMHARGYNIILLRDCTTAIEAAHTLPGLWLTEAAILNVELKVGVSTTSAELLQACRQTTGAPSP